MAEICVVLFIVRMRLAAADLFDLSLANVQQLLTDLEHLIFRPPLLNGSSLGLLWNYLRFYLLLYRYDYFITISLIELSACTFMYASTW